jgi:raffinose/stachyose/melibiose transport system permease protein
MNRSVRTSRSVWLLPALVISAGLIYYCIGYTAFISTLKWDGVSPDKISVGFANYVRVFADPDFWRALSHTVFFFFFVTFLGQLVLGLLFAVLLHSKVRLAPVYKVIVFLPVVLAPATMAPVFRQIYSPTGQFNGVLKAIGLGFLQQPWLGQSSTSLPVIMSIAIWGGTGVSFILYFAALSQIDNEILEAARIDGAGNVRTLVSIIWPGFAGQQWRSRSSPPSAR